MPRPNQNVEKAKNFKNAITRLFKELKPFKVSIIVAVLLTTISSLLAIFTPNVLSDLTNKISEGLVINKDNLETIYKGVSNDITEDSIKSIIKIDLKSLSKDEKELFLRNGFNNIDDELLNKVIVNNNINGVIITKDEQINLIKNRVISPSIGKLLINDIEIDGTILKGEDLAMLSSLIGITDSKEIYNKLDEMPDTIKKVIEPTMDVNRIKHLAIFLGIVYLISALFNYLESIIMTNTSNKFAFKLRSRIGTKLNKLPLKYFDQNQTGDTLSRITNDVDTVAGSMDQSIASLVSALALFIGTIVMMFTTNVIMAITAILSSLFGFIFMFIVLSKSQKYFIIRQKELGELNAHIEESYSGLNVIKAYNGEKEINDEFNKLNNKMYDANRKSRFLSGLMMPMMHFVGNFGYVAVCIVGALLVLNSKTDFGTIVAFITYVRLFTSPLSQIAEAMTSMQTVAAASERVFEFLDEKEMSSEKHITKTLENVKGDVIFKNVSFKYDGNLENTINNFSAKITRGSKVAIVGPTGAGKTTMVNLLMKFYDITDGDITIDGISIKELTRTNIHDLFTMVLQDTWVFNGTIKENIVFNKKNISDKEVEIVCKIVGLDHFVKTLPDGYNTILTDSDSISSGQKQLLTIARGILQNTPLLILDEATSNVDTRTEELVQKAMDELAKNKTSFIIAHRLSTIKNADLILVMKDGNIIEQGSHNELIEKNGFYAELYNSQFEL